MPGLLCEVVLIKGGFVGSYVCWVLVGECID